MTRKVSFCEVVYRLPIVSLTTIVIFNGRQQGGEAKRRIRRKSANHSYHTLLFIHRTSQRTCCMIKSLVCLLPRNHSIFYRRNPEICSCYYHQSTIKSKRRAREPRSCWFEWRTFISYPWLLKLNDGCNLQWLCDFLLVIIRWGGGVAGRGKVGTPVWLKYDLK